MMPTERKEAEGLDPTLALAFAPVHKRAFGMATGLTFGLLLFLLTAVAVVRTGAPPMLYSIRFLIPWHDVTWAGAVLGSLSGGFAFFVAGWFLAFVRNATLAVLVWMARTEAELAQSRDFLDHI